MSSIASVILIAGLFLVVLGVVFTRYQIIPFPLNFLVIPLGVLICLIGSVFFLIVMVKAPSVTTLMLLLMGVLPSLAIALLVGKGFSVPAIHDVATSHGELNFETAQELRAKGDNPLPPASEVSRKVILAQQAAYADLQPLVRQGSLDTVWRDALQCAAKMGWKITREQPPLQFEAVAQTPLLRFRDDVLVRLTQVDGQVKVDARSASRLGKSDLGANYTRLKTFFACLSPDVGQSQ